jgi:hypothetical protein
LLVVKEIDPYLSCSYWLKAWNLTTLKCLFCLVHRSNQAFRKAAHSFQRYPNSANEYLIKLMEHYWYLSPCKYFLSYDVILLIVFKCMEMLNYAFSPREWSSFRCSQSCRVLAWLSSFFDSQKGVLGIWQPELYSLSFYFMLSSGSFLGHWC